VDLGNCNRKLFYDWKGAPRKYTGNELLFGVGNAIHDIISDYFKRMGIWWGSEVRCGDKELNLSCRIDNIISFFEKDELWTDENSNFKKTIERNQLIPVEIKTIKKWATQKHYKSAIKSITEEPKENHLLQIQAYLMCGDFPYGLLVYIERDDCKVKAVWKVYPDRALWKEIRQQIEAVNIALENDEAPERCRESSNEYPCSWCQYREYCWSDESEKDGWLTDDKDDLPIGGLE
jgi:CRISPR/Cas system-associated exonuclease Cas4 (RecB family)